MNKILCLVILFIVIFMVSGCNTSETPTTPPIPTSPVTPTVPAVPTRPIENVTCNELSFYLDPALGEDYACESVPENSSSDIPAYYVFIYPAHTELTVQNYPLAQTQFPPQVWVYPVNRFSELLPELLPPRVADLERIISGGITGSGVLPFLPVIPQIQGFFVHTNSIAFNGGRGVRFITEYSDAPTPITNRNIFYTFQGLTDDGEYWVAVTLPLSSPILSDDYDTLPEGYTQDSLIQNYSSYVSEVKVALEAQPPGSFSPTIDILDNLVKSIRISQ